MRTLLVLRRSTDVVIELDDDVLVEDLLRLDLGSDSEEMHAADNVSVRTKHYAWTCSSECATVQPKNFNGSTLQFAAYLDHLLNNGQYADVCAYDALEYLRATVLRSKIDALKLPTPAWCAWSFCDDLTTLCLRHNGASIGAIVVVNSGTYVVSSSTFTRVCGNTTLWQAALSLIQSMAAADLLPGGP